MKTARPYLLCLWFLGLASIPMSMVPAQVFNYLTGLLQSGELAGYSAIWPVIVLFFLCRCGIAFIDVVRTMVYGYSLELIVRDFTLKVFGRVLRISPEFFQRYDAAKISNRVIRDTRVVEAFRLNLKVNVPLAAIGLLAYSYVLFCGLSADTPVVGYFLGSHTQEGNWLLGLLIVALSPIQSYFLLFDRKIQSVNRAAAIAGDNIASTAHETIAGVTEIRNNNAFEYAMSRVRHVFDVYREVQLKMTQLSAVFKGVGPMINALVNCILLAIGALLCLGDFTIPVLGITVGSIRWQDYMGFLFMAMTVHGYVGSMMRFFFRWRMTRQAIKRVDEYLESPIIFQEDPEGKSIDGARDPLAFDGIDYETSLGSRILNNLTLHVRPGEHVAFVGPSGSGKSTAMRLLMRDIFPSGGTVAFADKPLAGCNFASLAQETALVQQEPVIFNMSLRDNILFGLRRPSSDILPDTSGTLDLSSLNDVDSLKDLDSLLVAVLENVGLTPDVTRKALDNPCPPCFEGHSHILEAAASIKQEVRHGLDEAPEELVQFFDPTQYLVHATLLENLIWGVSREEGGIHRILADKGKGLTHRIHQLLENSPLLEQMVALGRWRFLHDRNAGAWIQQASPRLYALLSALGQEEGGLEDSLAGGKFLKQENAAQQKKHQRVLLEVALETHAQVAHSRFRPQDAFMDNILQARLAITKDPYIQTLNIARFDQSGTGSGLSMREVLVGGRVNPRVRGAYDQVDRILTNVLEARTLAQELLLMGLEAGAGVRGRNLSGGQAAKVALARAVIKNPSILMLDEVTAPLDERSKAGVSDLLEQGFDNRTVINVSHDLAAIRNYDRVVVFDRGQVVQDGSFRDLEKEPGLLQTLAGQQRGQDAPGPVPGDAAKITTEDHQQGTSELQRAIALSPTFSGLNIKQIAMLERLAQATTCSKGTVLFNKGDAGNEFFIVLDGEVELFLDRDKKGEILHETVAVLGPGAAFGELALFGGVPRTLGARARSDLRLCSILREDLLSLIQTTPEIAVMLLKTASQRIAGMMEQQDHEA